MSTLGVTLWDHIFNKIVNCRIESAASELKIEGIFFAFEASSFSLRGGARAIINERKQTLRRSFYCLLDETHEQIRRSSSKRGSECVQGRSDSLSRAAESETHQLEERREGGEGKRPTKKVAAFFFLRSVSKEWVFFLFLAFFLRGRRRGRPRFAKEKGSKSRENEADAIAFVLKCLQEEREREEKRGWTSRAWFFSSSSDGDARVDETINLSSPTPLSSFRFNWQKTQKRGKKVASNRGFL